MDPRDALDATIKMYRLKAQELAKLSGVKVQMLSRYRNKHQDMNSLNLFSVVFAMPEDAREYFWSCLKQGANFPPEINNQDSSREEEPRKIYFLSDVEDIQQDDEIGHPVDLWEYQKVLNELLVIEVSQIRADLNETRKSSGLSPYSESTSQKIKQLLKGLLDLFKGKDTQNSFGRRIRQRQDKSQNTDDD